MDNLLKVYELKVSKNELVIDFISNNNIQRLLDEIIVDIRLN